MIVAPTDGNQWLDDSLKGRFAHDPTVRLVYLFGSWASGRARAESDVDLAFWLDPVPPGDLFEVTGRLVRLCEGLVPSARMDIVVLNTASPVLRVQVLKTGRALYERAPGDSVRFAVSTARDCQDSAYWRETAYRYRLARIRKGVDHGGSRNILAAARCAAGLPCQGDRL